MMKVKPFVKWAGGKKQLLKEIDRVISPYYKNVEFTYVEPFVGGGAVLFWILQKYPNVKKVIINDINFDLINCYLIIKDNVEDMISILKQWESEYHSLIPASKERKEYYYSKREEFNRRNSNEIIQAALFIFLNKTCFNGLYRVNRKNEFNVPIGSYKKPIICDEDNLRAVSRVLQKVTILNGDFEITLKYANNFTLFYLDPPYKPLNKTSNFNSYTQSEFGDKDQIRLAKFCERIDFLGSRWILSNSDVMGNSSDDFFEKLYSKFNIKRVLAKRSINSNPDKRGKLTELLITNFYYEKVMSIT